LKLNVPLKINGVLAVLFTNGGNDALSLEKRARVEVFIPLREDDLAYQTVSQWVAEEFAFRRGGSTTTTAFLGLYASPTTDAVLRDSVQIIFSDILVDVGDIDASDQLVEELGLLRTDLETILREEEEIWITLSAIGIIRR
jgi:hypothetical protein